MVEGGANCFQMGKGCLGSEICALSAASSLSGPVRIPCLCVWHIRRALLLRDLDFVLLTVAQRSKAGSWRPLQMVFPSLETEPPFLSE